MERRHLLLSISFLLFCQLTMGQGPCGSGACEVCGISAVISSINGADIVNGSVVIPGQVPAGTTATGSTPFEITATTCGEINFTIDLDFDWDHGNNNNWLHGISFNNSPNWSAADGILPGPGWLFFPTITGVCSGVTYDAGYYYDPPGTNFLDTGNNSSFDGVNCNGAGGAEGISPWLVDGDPADNYGDDCQDDCPTFGFNLTYCPIDGGQTIETISFYLTEDGESGGWANSDQCVFILAFDIIINAAGVQLPENVGPICPGECVELDAGLGCEFYDWSTGEQTPLITVCPNETTDYSVTVTGSTGCKIEGEVQVLVEACCGAGAGFITTDPAMTCPGELINFSVANFNSATNFTQQLIVCNAAGEILQITNGSAGSISSNYCEIYSIYSYNYDASGGAATPVIGGNISALNCSTACCDLIMATIEFDETPPYFINLPQDETVNCGDPFPTPGPLFYENGISGSCEILGSVNPVVSTIDNITIYEWNYTSSCSGLTITHSQSITQTFDLAATINPGQANICPGEAFDLRGISLINANGVELSATYHSESPATLQNVITDPVVSPINTANYYILVTDDFGCEIEIPFELIVQEEPQAEIQAAPDDVLDCLAQTITLSATIENNVVYSWQIEAEIIVANEVQVTDGGFYQLLALDTLTGCSAKDEITIEDLEEYPIINIEPVSPLTCFEPVITIDASASQNSAELIYQWYNGSYSPISGANSNTLEVDIEGVYYLSLYDSENGCENIDTVVVGSILNIPLADTPDEIVLLCNETATTLEVATAGNPAWMHIQWTTVEGNIINGESGIQPEVEGLGYYYVSIQDIESGCIALDSILLSTNSDVPDVALLNMEDESCANMENGMLAIAGIEGGLPPYQYALNGAEVAGEPLFENLPPGNYNLNITDSNGCAMDTSIQIQPGIALDLQLPALIEILSTENGIATGIANVPEESLTDIQWSPAELVSCPDCLTTELLGENNQEYDLTIVHENGCVEEASIRLLIKPDINVYIPNVFSPNQDGANDQFTLYANEEIEKINELLIFDRWGELIFAKSDFPANDIGEGWNGFFKGQKMDAAVFVYIFKVQLQSGTERQYSGEVTLLD